MTESTTMTEEVVEKYLRFWNTEPAGQRRSGGEVFTEDIAYVGQNVVMTGVEALAGFTEQFAEHVGDYEFRARAVPNVHHDRARLRWEIRVGGTSFAEGTDVLTLAEDGRIASVTGFVDRAPDGADHAAD